MKHQKHDNNRQGFLIKGEQLEKKMKREENSLETHKNEQREI